MRLMLPALLALTVFGGVAAANPRGGHQAVGGHASRGHNSHLQRGHNVQVQRGHDTHAAQQRADHGVRHAAPVAHGGQYSAVISHGTSASHAPVVTHGGMYQQPHAVRHFDYSHRPALIVESHPHYDGYIWMAGQWTWNGYEWIWQAGRYEIDPAYGYTSAQPTYYGGY